MFNQVNAGSRSPVSPSDFDVADNVFAGRNFEESDAAADQQRREGGKVKIKNTSSRTGRQSLPPELRRPATYTTPVTRAQREMPLSNPSSATIAARTTQAHNFSLPRPIAYAPSNATVRDIARQVPVQMPIPPFRQPVIAAAPQPIPMINRSQPPSSSLNIIARFRRLPGWAQKAMMFVVLFAVVIAGYKGGSALLTRRSANN